MPPPELMRPQIEKNRRSRSLKLDKIKAQLAEAVETLEAIRSGAVDALVVHGPRGEQVFTLKGADQVYRAIVEAMNEGAVSVNPDQTVLYCNKRFAEIVKMPLEGIAGLPFANFVPRADEPRLREFLKKSLKERGTLETVLRTSEHHEVPISLSANPVLIDTDVGVSIVVSDITHRKRLERAQRELAKKILTAQEKERYRVSRELHDGINQLLSSVRHRFFRIEKNLTARKTQSALSELATTRQLLERTIDEVRRISRNLRPSELDDLGLIPALQSMVDDFEKRNDIRVRVQNKLRNASLEKTTELAVYRIVQEAFGNIERHAGASRVDLSLHRGDGALRIRIRDNGRGFDMGSANPQGFGLANMRERTLQLGGGFECRSVAGKGTEISVAVPA